MEDKEVKDSVKETLRRMSREFCEKHYSQEQRMVMSKGKPCVQYSLIYALCLASSAGNEDKRRAAEVITAAGDPANITGSSFDCAMMSHLLKLSETALPDDSIRRTLLRAISVSGDKVLKEAAGYTNNMVTIAGAGLVIGGEANGNELHVRKGIKMLGAFLDWADMNGGMYEYNSATYHSVYMYGACLAAMYAKNEQARELGERTRDWLWRDIAAHYHAPTMQLAGPHSRAYGTILQNYAACLKYYLYRVLGEAFVLGDNKEHGDDVSWAIHPVLVETACPPDALDMMTRPRYPRTVRLTAMGDGRRIGPGYDGPFTTATSYLHDKFALGTVSTAEVWWHRRNFMLYWLGPAGKTCVLNEFILHNDQLLGDKGRFWSAQKENKALVLHDFAHFHKKAIESFAVALVAELDGAPGVFINGARVSAFPCPFRDGDTLFLKSGGICMALKFRGAPFPGGVVRGEIRRGNETPRPVSDSGAPIERAGDLAIVHYLHKGSPRDVRPQELKGVTSVYAFEVRHAASSGEAEAFRREFEQSVLDMAIDPDSRISARWKIAGSEFELAHSGAAIENGRDDEPLGEGWGRLYDSFVDGKKAAPAKEFQRHAELRK